jgi:hypothetical protein
VTARAAAGWAALGAGACSAVLALIQPAERPQISQGTGATAGTEAPPATSSDRDGDVRVSRTEQKRIGLKTTVVSAVGAPALTQGFARGLDTGALAAIGAEIATARAAADASQAQAARLASLASQDQSASLQSVQAARAQAAADAARVELATRRIGFEYGPGLARLGPAARERLVADIAAGRAALVRVDVPGTDLADLSGVRLSDGGGSLRVLGPAAAADPRLQSGGVLAVLRGPAAASATNGRVFGVTIARGGTVAGALVPRAAVLRWRGGLWVYRQQGPESFARTELVGGRPIADGWFVPSGVKPGDRIATESAGTLLAIDSGGGAAPDPD